MYLSQKIHILVKRFCKWLFKALGKLCLLLGRFACIYIRLSVPLFGLLLDATRLPNYHQAVSLNG